MNNNDISYLISMLNNMDKKQLENGLNQINQILGPEEKKKIIQALNNNNNTKQNEDKKQETSNIDMETILKIKSIMENLNKKDDPRANLLYSLKPYLRESRQKKVDQYVNIFKIAQITNLFKNEKGDVN